jgi:uncharacterized Ntn-hydrolase superfamily protein
LTFSLAVRDPDSGAFGIVVSSSSPAVAARCLHLRPGVGAATSQNVTNPALGSAILDSLATGADAADAVRASAGSDQFFDYRQLTAVDADGRIASFSGARVLGIHATARGFQAVAAGNMLAHEGVAQAMIDGYAASHAETLEQRLLAGFMAAVNAGGEAGPIRSAGLAVVEDAPWRVTDLRVDDAEDPASELARLAALWLPQKRDYLTRAIDPTAAPSYGVPGDE